jgi:hypothetical protein
VKIFRKIWSGDFEFQRADNRDPPVPVCLVARELHSKREVRLFQDELAKLTAAPFDTGPDACFVSFAVAAEASCFAALGWPMPANNIDLYAENLLRLNGRPRRQGDASLLGAMGHYGLTAMTTARKEAMRAKIMEQSDWSAEEQAEILDYCAEDVDAAERLLLAMDRRGDIDWPRALWRGEFMATMAFIEHVGIPIDSSLYFRLQKHWDAIRLRLIDRVDRAYGVYVDGSFNRRLFAAYLVAHDIPWPRLPGGSLSLDGETFKAMAKAYPILAPLRELIVTLAQMRSTGLAVGSDARNRYRTRPMLSKTGRNQPSNSANILGGAAWLRGLITPPPGHALALIDWSAQEIAIAAGLSGDEKLRAAYTNDIHMEVAIATGLAPRGATKDTHPEERDRAKPVSLGLGYGISDRGIAQTIGVPRVEAQRILEAHHAAFPEFWAWLRRTVDNAMLRNEMRARMGWRMAITGEPNPRALQNWPMQATGAEMLRAAVVKMMRAGLTICATAHDAIMILAPLARWQSEVAEAQEIMSRVSLSFTRGLWVPTTAKVLLPGERLVEKRGERMWTLMMSLLAEVEPQTMGTMDDVMDGYVDKKKEEDFPPSRPIAPIAPIAPIDVGRLSHGQRSP